MAARRDDELYRSREAQLYIQDGEESMLMQCGDFTLVLVKNALSHLAAVVAMVGAVQWPLGRDCTVVRTGKASFSFSLPGPLCYALVLKSTSSADLQMLEKVLEDYFTCSPQLPAAAAATPAAGVLEKEDLKQVEKRLKVCCDEGKLKMRSGDDMSPEMEGRMQRARRMSAVEKVFSKSLERGAISMAYHVQPMDLATHDSQSSPLNLALARVDAVAKVVEAVETGGRSLLESALSMAAMEPASLQESSSEVSHSGSGVICSDWTLNKHGLLMLYRVITASMAIHSGGSSRSGSSRSSSSSSSEFRRLLSSSSSSSSSTLSSKSLMASVPHTQPGAVSRGTDGRSSAALRLPAAGTAMLPCLPIRPLLAACTSRVRKSDAPLPPMAPGPHPVPLPSDSPLASPFRVYKPRPTPATASTPLGGPPPFPPRPPRFQPPQN